MEKALEMLYQLQNDYPLYFDDKVEEAIAELEEAMKPNCCAICNQFKKHNRYKMGICEKGHADSTRGGLYTVDYNFCCNRYEPKDTQC